jgi:hypothetical protein
MAYLVWTEVLKLDLYHVFSLLLTFATMHAHKSLKEHKFLLQCEVMQGTFIKNCSLAPRQHIQ